MLASWTARGSASSLRRAARPRLLVVASIPSDAFDSEALRFRLRVLSDPKFLELFSSLKVINLLGTSRTPTHQHFSGLLQGLQNETHLMRAERVNTYILFSIIYIAVFFDTAIR